MRRVLIVLATLLFGAAALAQPLTYPTTQAMLAGSPGGAALVLTQGYSTQGDNGAAAWVPLSGPPGAYSKRAADGSQWILASNPIMPEMLGAFPDGTTNESSIFSAILNYYSGVPMRLNCGVYFWSAQVNVTKADTNPVVLLGSGSGSALNGTLCSQIKLNSDATSTSGWNGGLVVFGAGAGRPTLSATPGGSNPQTSYFVRRSFVTTGGVELAASPLITMTVPANNQLTITGTSPPASIASCNYYAGTSPGTETWQVNVANCAAYTFPSITTTGAQVPVKKRPVVTIGSVKIFRTYDQSTLSGVTIGPKSIYVSSVDGANLYNIDESKAIGFGISFDYSKNVRLDSSYVHDHYSGEAHDSGTDGIDCWYSDNCIVTNSTIARVGDDAISFAGNPFVWSTNNYVFNNFLISANGSIKLYNNIANTLVTGNTSTFPSTDIAAQSGELVNAIIDQTSWEGQTGGTPSTTAPGATSMYNVQIGPNNTCDGNALRPCIEFDFLCTGTGCTQNTQWPENMSYVRITGNTVSNNLGYGIGFLHSSYDFAAGLLSVDHFVIDNNNVFYAKAQGTFAGITANVGEGTAYNNYSDVLIDNNTIDQSTQGQTNIGIAVVASAPASGQYFKNLIISNNHISNTASEGIQVGQADGKLTITGNSTNHTLFEGITTSNNSFGPSLAAKISNNTIYDYTYKGSSRTGRNAGIYLTSLTGPGSWAVTGSSIDEPLTVSPTYYAIWGTIPGATPPSVCGANSSLHTSHNILGVFIGGVAGTC